MEENTNKNAITEQSSTYNTIEEDRVNNLRKHKAKEAAGFTYKQVQTAEANSTLTIEFNENDLTDTQKHEVSASTLCAVTGTANHAYHIMHINQLINAFHQVPGTTSADILNATTAALLSMDPKDAIEGQLCSRLLVLHNHLMHYMMRAANPEQPSAFIEMNINCATKLGRLYNETLDALNKHRRKGEQKFTVQHVNVANGGQAIVGGNFTPGGGAQAKKREGVTRA